MTRTMWITLGLCAAACGKEEVEPCTGGAHCGDGQYCLVERGRTQGTCREAPDCDTPLSCAECGLVDDGCDGAGGCLDGASGDAEGEGATVDCNGGPEDSPCDAGDDCAEGLLCLVHGDEGACVMPPPGCGDAPGCECDAIDAVCADAQCDVEAGRLTVACAG